MHEISKDFTWDMGHRLTTHSGKCYNLHGHTYRMRVTLRGELGDHGMVMDFYDLGQVVKPLVEELDHAFMVSASDRVLIPFFSKMKAIALLIEDLGKEVREGTIYGEPLILTRESLPRPFKVVIVPFETTAENIARGLYQRIKKSIPIVSSVTVWETPTSSATYPVKESVV